MRVSGRWSRACRATSGRCYGRFSTGCFESTPRFSGTTESGAQRRGKERLAHQEPVDGRGGGTAFGDRPHDQALTRGPCRRRRRRPAPSSSSSRPCGRCRAGRSRRRAARACRCAAGRRSPSRAAPGRTASSNSVPSTGSNIGRPSRITISTSRPCNVRTLPSSSPVNLSVPTEKTRSPPSSCAEEVRKISGHCGHGLESRALLGRARHDLELVHRRGALPVHGAEAVGAGVAAADDDHVLALGGDLRLRGSSPRPPCSTTSGSPSRSGCR